MQVVEPIDIADALVVDLKQILTNYRIYGIPIPHDVAINDVCIEQLGGSRVSGASNVYDVTFGCYADNDAAANAIANEVAGIVASLPLRETLTQYNAANVNSPYADYDPRAPHLARESFRASITCPGKRLVF
jgi:hypothetical protein